MFVTHNLVKCGFQSFLLEQWAVKFSTSKVLKIFFISVKAKRKQHTEKSISSMHIHIIQYTYNVHAGIVTVTYLTVNRRLSSTPPITPRAFEGEQRIQQRPRDFARIPMGYRNRFRHNKCTIGFENKTSIK